MIILSVDTETTGTDFYHGCKAFMVQACDGEYNYVWEGEVDLYNRADIYWDPSTLAFLQRKLDKADVIIFHNAKFDMRALASIGIDISHLWKKVEDTVLASHCLCSGESHALKYLAFKYLGYYNDDEHALEQAVKSARSSAPPDWDIARKGHRCFPALGGSKVKWFRMDYWLCMEECREYGKADVEMTWLLWKVFEPALKKEKLYQQYLTRRELLLIAYEAETVGYNYYSELVEEQISKLKKETEDLRLKIQTDNYYNWRLELGKPEHLKFLFHEKLKIEPEYFTDGGSPSMRQEAVDAYIEKYPEIETVQDFKKWKTKTTQISDVSTFSKWVCDDGRLHADWWLTGTRETRQSIHDPALQTIGKSIRHLFGPPPGYVWLDYDLVNIEMRIWTYLVGNQELIDVFEKGGSVHLLIASIIHPELWAQFPGEKFKKEFVETWYQWVKNGNFSIIYGATKRRADLTYKKAGSYDLIARRFPEVPEFTARCIEEVWNNLRWHHSPYVEVAGGYHLEVPLDDIFKAVNYKIQGGAGWMMNEAMIEISNNTEYLNSGAAIVNQVHDSLTIELPRAALSQKVIESIREAMEAPGYKYMPTSKASVDIITHYNEPEFNYSNNELVEVPF